MFSTFNLKSESNQVTVPISITVNGKLVITDANNDNNSTQDPTLNVHLKLTPDLSNPVVSGNSSLRIRTNLNNWKLTAQRHKVQNSITNISPKDISLSYTVQAGSKADPDAAKLLSPFDKVTDLSQISESSPVSILSGKGKTSIARDSGNKDNWFQVNAKYSTSPDFFYGVGEWNTVVSYSLVSP